MTSFRARAPWPRMTRELGTDLLLMVLLVVVNAGLAPVITGAVEGPEGWTHPVAGQVLGVVLGPTLLVRRRSPLTLLVLLQAVGLGADYAGIFVWGLAAPGIALAAYSVGRYLPLTRALVGLGVGVAADLATTTLSPTLRPPVGWFDYALYLAWIVGSWWVGRLVRMRAFDTAELRARAERLERAQEAHARAVRAEERSRIARELHDVVAHNVSVMTVQATAGQRVLDRSPERARQALSDIEDSGRQALAEMRRIIGVLRTPGAQEGGTDTGGGAGEADRGPLPGVAALPELVRQLDDTGMAVTLRTEGEARTLPPGLDLTLYRIAQESLTNVLKHAGPGAGAEVALRFERRAVVLTVEDDGAGGPEPGVTRAGDEPGHGLLGMRERVELFGGELAAGPRPGGGFGVRVRVPVEAGSGR